ncbi:bifunctional 3,4-dihydroxy-2-butanone-4-phosphate synthase/GTP cyclohydrolase II [Cupriavidus sp. 2TAF22]|uniref:bifunctional 3,4-dihydroxy-2-butanone-4-phosphate synthase/GTP cyclohydrolase II n=1 Tax=unclassified Cupriavidus TaxID=2640874 RepID=UPI003F901042
MNPSLSTIPELLADLAAGSLVILVDDADRENEGDLVIAADHITPDAINFMAKHGRGLICLTLTREHCQRLRLPPMTTRNGAAHGTAFTVSIEAARGVTTGISASDRARTVQAAVARDATPGDLVQPGHIFPLQARDGGVLVRAGHTEAGCDLSAMAGRSSAAVICEIMNDDGTMARMPDLEIFARRHGLKIGSIADLIEYRSRNETLIKRVSEQILHTAQGEFNCIVFRDHLGGTHLALTCGQWSAADEVLVRVHEPMSMMDLLSVNTNRHSWSLSGALAKLQASGRGAALLLNCGEDPEALASHMSAPDGGALDQKPMDLRTHGIGAQILRDLNIARMTLLASPRRLPSMAGYGLEVVSFLEAPAAIAKANLWAA